MKPKLLRVFVVIATALVTGCEKGPEVAPVTGTVQQNGKPLAGAMVEFQPDYGAPSYGYTDQQGQYEIQFQKNRMGALIGHHTVRVRTIGEKTDLETDTTVNVPETVPELYNDETTLEFDVVAGEENVFDIDIEGERPRRGRRR